MKKFLSIALVIAMMASMFVIGVSAAADVWDGTADTSWYNDTAKEFTLTTAKQLAGLAELVNKGNAFAGKTIKLGADIQLNSDADLATVANWGTAAPKLAWTPIGYEGAGTFSGTFDGAGKTISGMYINSADGAVAGGRVALFGKVTGGEIKDLTVTKSYVNGKTCAAILVAFTNGIPTLTNITVTESEVVGTTDGTSMLVGKSGGFAEVNFTNCHVAGKMTASFAMGGLIGYISGTGAMGTMNIKDCSTDLDITATFNDSRASGGAIGVFGNLDAKAGDGTAYAPTLDALNISGGDYKVKAVANRTFGGVIGQTNLTDIKALTIDGAKVNVDIDTSASIANNSDIGAVIGYLRADQVTGTITIKNVEVAGRIVAGQNSAILIGRINNRTANAGDVASIVVDNVKTTVAYETAKGNANVQEHGAVIGLNQKTIANLTVNAMTTNNTFKASSANGKDGTGSDVGGLIGGAGTIKVANITNCSLNDTIEGSSNIAGVVGAITIGDTFTVKNTTVASNVTGTKGLTAGILANVKSGSKNIVIDNTLVSGTITALGTDKNSAGGMISRTYAMDTTITNSGVTGTIATTDKGSRNVGGFISDIVSLSTTTLDGCYFTGKIATAENNGYHLGALIADYDPDGGNGAADKGEFAGQIILKNCYVNTDMKGQYNVGGAMGRIYSKNCILTVEDCVFLGDRVATAADKATQVAATLSFFGTAYTKGELITIDNVYYDGIKTAAQVIAPNSGTVNMFAKNVYYTPATDAGKAGDKADFVKGLDANIWDTATLTLKHTAGAPATPTTPPTQDTTKAPTADTTKAPTDDTTGTVTPAPTGDAGTLVWVALAAVAMVAIVGTALVERKRTAK